jgi:hypothetical protein
VEYHHARSVQRATVRRQSQSLIQLNEETFSSGCFTTISN